MTTEEIELEIQKCKDDPVYFHDNYFTVNGKKVKPLNDNSKFMMREIVKAHKEGYALVMGNVRGGKRMMKQVLTADIIEHMKPDNYNE